MQARQMPSTADRAAVEKAIIANENKINDAFAKSDVAAMKAMIAPDAVTVDASGVTPVAEFFKQMPTMAIKITGQQLTNFKFVWSDANTVVATYTWSGKGTVMGQPVTSPTYGTTVWSKRGAAWLPVFHQETAAQPMPAPGAKPAPAGTAGAKPAPGR
jgi:ketosteroid isomerase-like protein